MPNIYYSKMHNSFREMQSPILTPKSIQLLKKKAKEYKMKLLAIFGSYAREEQKQGSDRTKTRK